jgi:hypothetical protein
MNKVLVGVMASVGGVLLILGMVAMLITGAANSANRYEQGIKAADSAMEAVLSGYSTSIVEMSQVPDMYKADFKETVTDILAARYGADGVNSAMTLIVEAYPGEFDSSLYTRLQDRISAGRANFTAEQKILVDRIREYETALGSIPTGFFMGVMGYPKIDVSEYSVISDSTTQEIFINRVDKPITLR